MKQLILASLIALTLAGCTGLPEDVTPVSGFEADRYLGRWYEIARLDHSFERGLSNISAQYTLRKDGGIDVLNCGYSSENNEWKEAQGKAYFIGSPGIGHLKVSFFGPFYGSYVVFDLDKKDYQYAYVSGPNKDYLWFLSRTPKVSEQSYQRFLDKAESLGFDSKALIRVNQTGSECPAVQ
ncbi:lipocalin family protein [Parendozoicomonas haliclonae]|uniref:Outer membrane lipoprotein Blc n=1 Tax=Parendozoicomonas haliclonae TaxID=1960125 RepID=A0A1X7AME5_9GAMM|nr:lipocalin family protein [Parendozoicomonas haliclonae]SMA49380.1 Outer membrane lipoprotein Blc precursor [Parendozoicomonas haliclonae]